MGHGPFVQDGGGKQDPVLLSVVLRKMNQEDILLSHWKAVVRPKNWEERNRKVCSLGSSHSLMASSTWKTFDVVFPHLKASRVDIYLLVLYLQQ